ncbi:MAG: T9SS type A sorting domain-containing protein, partial [Candidatus Eisenbacteria bacterium]|nr:T9SS type A sorting domain-containing protein [Candidatus Eisenbacteria bacterium]
FWPNQSRIVPLASENLSSNIALSYGADVYLRAGELTVNTANGYFPPGEVRALSLELLHIGVAGTTTGGVTVKLSTSDPNLTLADDTALYPNLSSSGTALPMAGDLFQAALSPSAVPGSEILIDVEITDGAGYYGTDQVSFRVGEPVVVFSDDAESGLVNWTASGGFGTETIDGSTWFSDSPGSNYPNSSDARLTLNFGLDLTGGTHALLVFDLLYNIEGGYDWAVVEASTDGGTNWDPLPGKHTVLGESSSGSYGGTVQQMGEPGYEMNRKVVVREEIDLASVVGQSNVLLRYRMVSDGGLNQDGIQVDNLEVRVYAPGSLGTPPTDAVTALRLLPPAPNPFQEETRIIYSVPKSMPVSVSVYDVTGRRIRTLTEGLSAPGEKSLVWDGTSGLGREVSAGIYYVRIDTPEESISKKVTVVQ